MLGLFLLGRWVQGSARKAAGIGVVAGVLVIGWISLSRTLPESWAALRSPFHELLAVVGGTLTILLVGWVGSRLQRARGAGSAGPSATVERR